MEKRFVKALSEQQIADLKAGRGMGLALAAELNGYPGPLHVLEFSQALQLSAIQRKRTEELMARMKTETITIGERIIAGETALDRLFVEKRVTEASLDEATSRIGAAQAELRSAHLRYHLTMVEILFSCPNRRVRCVTGVCSKRSTRPQIAITRVREKYRSRWPLTLDCRSTLESCAFLKRSREKPPARYHE